jgi:hypothetical protein
MRTIVRKNGGGGKRRRTSAAARKRAATKPPAKSAGSTPARRIPRDRLRTVAGNVYHPGPPIDGDEALGAAVARLLALDPDVMGKLV